MSKKFGPFSVIRDENIFLHFAAYEEWEWKHSHEYKRKHEWGRVSQIL